MPDLIQIYHMVQELGACSLIDHRQNHITIMMQTQGSSKTRIEVIVQTQESCKIVQTQGSCNFNLIMYRQRYKLLIALV